MWASVICANIAVRATAGASGWLVLPGDLPLVQPHTLRAVAQALASHAVVAPVYRGERGHPVGFAAPCAQQLAALAGEQEVLLALGLFDLVVEVAQGVLELLRLELVGLPRGLELLGVSAASATALSSASALACCFPKSARQTASR